MILTGNDIIKNVMSKKITIKPFNIGNVQPNSIDVTLGNKLMYYNITTAKSINEDYLDPRKENKTIDVDIPEDGYILEPGIVYLGIINEFIGSDIFIPEITGKSSLARLGLEVHRTACYGNLGNYFKYVLEITCVHRIKIYPNMKIGQIYFHQSSPDRRRGYKGKYQNQDTVIASRYYQE